MHSVGDVVAGVAFLLVDERTDAWHTDGEIGFRELLLGQFDV